MTLFSGEVSYATISIGTACLLTVSLLYKIIYALFISEFRNVPGPRLCKISRLYLAYHDFRLTRNEKVYSWHEQYGPVVAIAPGEVSLSRPGATREIYGAAGRHPKSDYFLRFATYGERPTFTVKEYDEHRDKRRLTFSLFQPTTIYSAAYVDPIRQRAQTFVDEIGKDIRVTPTLDLFARATFYIFDNMTRFAYGPRHCALTIENKCKERSILTGLRECEIWNNRLFDVPVLHQLFQKSVAVVTQNPAFLTAEHQLTEWNNRRFAAATDDPHTAADSSLLRFLLQAKTRAGTGLTRNYVLSEVLDNLNGAQTTTTAALTYVFWNLARHPTWQQAARSELESLDRQADGLPSFADINAGPVLEACIRESYRVNPISSGRAERIVPLTKEYDGIALPTGTIVSTSTIAMHRSPDEFPAPRTFDPKRWLDASEDQLKAMEACYMPFGQGTRVCIGRALATVQIKMLVGALLLNYQLEVDSDCNTTTEQTMRQMSTQDALPWGLRCDLKITPIAIANA